MISQINAGNVQLEAGKKFDTGIKYTDSSGSRAVFRKVVDFGALPNTTTKNVAHGESVDPDLATGTIYANDGTTALTLTPSLTATNISLTTTSDLSSYANAIAIIEYVES